MSTIAHRTDDHGEFGIVMPDGDIIYCTVNSESKEDASMVCDAINKDARDLEALRSGQDVVVPTSRDHAHNLVTMGKAFLNED